MWLLIVTIWSTNPSLSTESMSKGNINAKFISQTECLKAKEQFRNIQLDSYRVVASCIFK